MSPLLLAGLLFSFTLFGISYTLLDMLGGRSAFERNRMHTRIRHLEPSRNKIRIEKNQKHSEIESLNELLKRQEFTAKLDRLIKVSGWRISAGVFILIVLLAGFVTTYIILSKGVPLIPALLCGIVVAVIIPAFVLKLKYAAYIKKFTLYFPRALQVIRGSLNAGLGFGTSFERAAQDSPYPVNVEFKQVLDEMALGKSLVEGLSSLQKRIPTIDVKTFLIAISVQQESGGNLTELMHNLEDTITARMLLRKELNVMTAQARVSGIILWALPFAVGFAVWLMNPDYINILFQDPRGHLLLIGTAVLQIIGIFWIKKLINIKIAT